jgi:hypothetical protein
MVATTLEASAKREVEGFYASCYHTDSLWIAASVRDRREGIKLSDDVCSLMGISGRVSPAAGLARPAFIDPIRPLFFERRRRC